MLILEGGTGSDVPGAFFTFLLEPQPAIAIELAQSFAVRKDPSHAVMIGKLPLSVFERLKATGAVYSTPLPGAELEQTIFLPQAFRVINYHNLLNGRLFQCCLEGVKTVDENDELAVPLRPRPTPQREKGKMDRQ